MLCFLGKSSASWGSSLLVAVDWGHISSASALKECVHPTPPPRLPVRFSIAADASKRNWAATHAVHLCLLSPDGGRGRARTGTGAGRWAVAGRERLCNERRMADSVDALRVLDEQGGVGSVEMYRDLLRDCCERKAVAEAKQVYAHIVKNRLESNAFLGNYAVSMFVKCESLSDALEIFRRLPERNVYSWMALISEYTRCGQAQEALRVYEEMVQGGVKPDRYILSAILKACGSLGDLEEGKRIHAEVVRNRCESDLFVGTALVDMFAKCGSIEDAQQVFDTLHQRNIVSWNAMIAGYVQKGQGEKACELFDRMEGEGVRPDNWTFVSMLKACGSLGAMEQETVVEGQGLKLGALAKGKQIHEEVVKRRYEWDPFIGNTLVHMYYKCGDMVGAREHFDGLLQRDVVSWNAMLSGYAQREEGEKVFELYAQMLQEGVRADRWTFVSLLKACSSVADLEKQTVVDGRALKVEALRKGESIHAQIVRGGYDQDEFIGNTLVHMYAKCGSVFRARQIFDGLVRRDVVSWTAMIAGYSQQEQGENALEVYRQMQEAGVSPNSWTLVSLLKGCGNLATLEEETLCSGQVLKVASLERVRAVHEEAVKRGFDSDLYLSTALVDVYAKCGSMENAQQVFDTMPQRSLVSWSAMIAGYSQQEEGEKALQLYSNMQKAGMKPDETTFLCLLKACSNVGALKMCQQIHEDIVECGMNSSLVLANTLIHAYGKCGSMENARDVFDAMPEQDVVSWTALISGYARQGQCDKTLESFEKMQQSGLLPTAVTFVSVLTACSYSGKVEEGLQHFVSMMTDHCITPTIQHYGILVDLLGRTGLFSKVEEVLLTMPMEPDLPMWLSILASCRNYSNVRVGREAFENAVRLDSRHRAAYVLMLDIYAHAQMWGDANKIDELQKGIRHAPNKTGQSWIEHDGKVHVFVVGDVAHQERTHLYTRLELLNAEIRQHGIP